MNDVKRLPIEKDKLFVGFYDPFDNLGWIEPLIKAERTIEIFKNIYDIVIIGEIDEVESKMKPFILY